MNRLCLDGGGGGRGADGRARQSEQLREVLCGVARRGAAAACSKVEEEMLESSTGRLTCARFVEVGAALFGPWMRQLGVMLLASAQHGGTLGDQHAPLQRLDEVTDACEAFRAPAYQAGNSAARFTAEQAFELGRRLQLAPALTRRVFWLLGEGGYAWARDVATAMVALCRGHVSNRRHALLSVHGLTGAHGSFNDGRQWRAQELVRALRALLCAAGIQKRRKGRGFPYSLWPFSRACTECTARTLVLRRPAIPSRAAPKYCVLIR